MTQPTLFDPGATATAAHRHSDRSTAVAAAESFDAATLNREQQRVLDAMRLLAALDQPVTAGRVTGLLGDRQRNCVARRITDLARRGLVAEAGIHREDRKGARPETLWSLA